MVESTLKQSLSIHSETVANAMIETFSRVGIPGEILTDQEANFMSSLISQLCTVVGIKKTDTSSYHPQAIGLVEKINGTLKKMLCANYKLCKKTGSSKMKR